MLELIKNDILGGDFPHVRICDYELKQGRFLPTYDLLVGLKNLHPNFEFHMCIGADLVNGIRTWDDGDKLVTENSFIIMKREGYEYDKEKKPEKSVEINTNIYGSSTSIRNRIKTNCGSSKKFNIYGLTSKSCIEYIMVHNLYQ
jgi:nicotinic acid mononucleotide adenylyltransferase